MVHRLIFSRIISLKIQWLGRRLLRFSKIMRILISSQFLQKASSPTSLVYDNFFYPCYTWWLKISSKHTTKFNKSNAHNSQAAGAIYRRNSNKRCWFDCKTDGKHCQGLYRSIHWKMSDSKKKMEFRSQMKSMIKKYSSQTLPTISIGFASLFSLLLRSVIVIGFFFKSKHWPDLYLDSRSTLF